MAEEKQPLRPETPEEIIDELTWRADQIQASYVDGATKWGYIRDTFRAARPAWEELGSSGDNSPQALSIRSSGISYLGALRDELRMKQASLMPPVGGVDPFVQAAGTASITTAITAVYIGVPDKYPLTLPPPTIQQEEQFAQKLSKLNPALGKTYQEIWEVLYGTRADPERAAEYMIRQAYDHFFDIFAPDTKVRDSIHWQKKNGDDPNQVTRMERIQFAAAECIEDESRRKTMLASAKHMLEVHAALSKAHVRGDLDREKARLALTEMRNFLEEWAFAIKP